MPFDVFVFKQDIESLRDGFFVCAAAYVEEVCGVAAEEFDDVHSGHCKTRAVDHAGDIAVKCDIIEAEFACFNLLGILFVRVAQGFDFGVAEESVVVERDLGVEANDFAVFGQHEGVYFDHRAVFRPE